jgi:spore maturation protein CgeB
MSHGVNRGVLKPNKFDERYPFIDTLVKKNPNIIFDIYGYKNRQPIWSSDFYRVIQQSKMALNLSRTNSVKYYSSNRISSLIGNGLMTFIDEKTKLSDFFTKDEVIFYKDLNDLSNKLNFYKQNDTLRKKIAKNGRKKYFELFDSKCVSDYIISKIFEVKPKKNLKWFSN